MNNKLPPQEPMVSIPWWLRWLPRKKPVRILDLGKVKTIADLKDLYVIRELAPYEIRIRPHKDTEKLLQDIEHLFVDEGE